MTDHHRIEFEPGEVVKPEYDPSNNLTGLLVTDEGLERLRADLAGSETENEYDPIATPNNPNPDESGHPELQGEPFDSGSVDLGFGRIEYEVHLPAELQPESNERP